MFNFDYANPVFFDNADGGFTLNTCGFTSKGYDFYYAASRLINLANKVGGNSFTRGFLVDEYVYRTDVDIDGLMNINKMFGFVSEHDSVYTVMELAYDYYNAVLYSDNQRLYDVCMLMHIKAATNTEFASWYILWNDVLPHMIGKVVNVNMVEEAIARNTVGFRKMQIKRAAADAWRLLKHLYVANTGSCMFSMLGLFQKDSFKIVYSGAPVNGQGNYKAVSDVMEFARSLVSSGRDCVALNKDTYEHIGKLIGYPAVDFRALLSKMSVKGFVRYEAQLDHVKFCD